MSGLPVINPAVARKVWESMPDASTRRVATRLRQAGSTISHETIRRWRRDGWRSVEQAKHPLDAARAALDDAVPVLTGDATGNVSALVEESPERDRLECLSDAELLRAAARQLLVAVYVGAAGVMRDESLVVTRIGALGVLLRALAASITAATLAFGQLRSMKSTQGA